MFFGRLVQKGLHFGKQLQGGVMKFGSQVNHMSTKIGQGIDKAERTVSKIEKYTNNIPVVGGVVKTVDKGIKTVGDINKLGGLVGQATTELASGKLHSFARTVDSIKNEGKQTFNDAKSAVSSGAGVASKFI